MMALCSRYVYSGISFGLEKQDAKMWICTYDIHYLCIMVTTFCCLSTASSYVSLLLTLFSAELWVIGDEQKTYPYHE